MDIPLSVLVLDILYVVAIAIALAFVIREMVYHKEQTLAELKVGGWLKTAKVAIISIVFLFLDMFGIGSYGPHIACWKIFKVTRDAYIPGTLNVCMLTATAVESVYLLTMIQVEMTTLVPCIIASTVGSWLGGGIVVKLDVNKVRLAVGVALVVVACVILAGLVGILDIAGGDAHGLSGWKLIVIVLISLIFGALMTIGIGIYAPLLAVASILGMDPTYAVPIMLGTCAFLIPVAAIRFAQASLKSDKPKYDRKIAIVENITGPIGPIIAANVILSLPITTMKWIVVVVLYVVSAMMLYQWYTKAEDKVAEEEDAEIAAQM